MLSSKHKIRGFPSMVNFCLVLIFNICWQSSIIPSSSDVFSDVVQYSVRNYKGRVKRRQNSLRVYYPAALILVNIEAETDTT